MKGDRMTTAGAAIGDRLRNFTENTSDKHDIVELLRFFGRRPNTRFNRQAIIRTSNSSRKTEKALKYLIDTGAVKECDESNILTYVLTDKGWMHNLAKDLASLDWAQFNITLRQILQSPRDIN